MRWIIERIECMVIDSVSSPCFLIITNPLYGGLGAQPVSGGRAK